MGTDSWFGTSRTWVQVLGVAASLATIAGAVIAVLALQSDNGDDRVTTGSPTTAEGEPSPSGSDEEGAGTIPSHAAETRNENLGVACSAEGLLSPPCAELVSRCQAQDWSACDVLYFSSDENDLNNDLASYCAYHSAQPRYGHCQDEMG